MSFQKIYGKLSNDVQNSKESYEMMMETSELPNEGDGSVYPHPMSDEDDETTRDVMNNIENQSRKVNLTPRLGVPRDISESFHENENMMNNNPSRIRLQKEKVYLTPFVGNLQANNGNVQAQKFTNTTARRRTKLAIWNTKSKIGDLKSIEMKQRKQNNKKKKKLKKWKEPFNASQFPGKKPSYKDFLGLNEIWKKYIMKLSMSKGKISNEEALLKADYHGAKVCIRKSSCESYIGVEGFIMKETENTFQIITKKNKVKTILKRGTIFDIELGNFWISIFGNNFCYRPFIRSARKFKQVDSFGMSIFKT